ncbi:MAG: GNAT family acetyltransferase, partial [Proteobacteria bacterium]|nr:GNAT family acetyltransferase [Pseudomonadota bacterium]
HLEDFFIKELIPICCEVNSFPRNEVSINFHIKNGFEHVGEHDFDDHSVIYFRKIYIK